MISIVKVGNGLGFVVGKKKEDRLIITAASLVAEQLDPGEDYKDRLYLRFVGPLDDFQNIAVKCDYLDSEIAVLSCPTGQNIGHYAVIFEELVSKLTPLKIASPPSAKEDDFGVSCKAFIDEVPCEVLFRGEVVWLIDTSFQPEIIGSPILNAKGDVLGVLTNPKSLSESLNVDLPPRIRGIHSASIPFSLGGLNPTLSGLPKSIIDRLRVVLSSVPRSTLRKKDHKLGFEDGKTWFSSTRQSPDLCDITELFNGVISFEEYPPASWILEHWTSDKTLYDAAGSYLKGFHAGTIADEEGIERQKWLDKEATIKAEEIETQRRREEAEAQRLRTEEEAFWLARKNTGFQVKITNTGDKSPKRTIIKNTTGL